MIWKLGFMAALSRPPGACCGEGVSNVSLQGYSLPVRPPGAPDPGWCDGVFE